MNVVSVNLVAPGPIQSYILILDRIAGRVYVTDCWT